MTEECKMCTYPLSSEETYNGGGLCNACLQEYNGIVGKDETETWGGGEHY